MILPEGFEKMTDADLVKALVAGGAYDKAEAEAIVAMLKAKDPIPVD